MYVTTKNNFPKKFILKVLYLNSTNRNFMSHMEGAISINALIPWHEQILQAISYKLFIYKLFICSSLSYRKNFKARYY